MRRKYCQSLLIAMVALIANQYDAAMEKEKSQLDRFKEAARELEADDDEAKFNEKLGKLVKQKPDAKQDD